MNKNQNTYSRGNPNRTGTLDKGTRQTEILKDVIWNKKLCLGIFDV